MRSGTGGSTTACGEPPLPLLLSHSYSRIMGSSVPRLVGAHEIRVRLGGISRQRVYQITEKPHFPRPLAELESGRVWAAADVEAWIAERRPHQADVDG